MTPQQIKENAPEGAQYYCEYPITIYDKRGSYLKSRFKLLFRWECGKWVFICFPFRQGDCEKNGYIKLKPL